MDDEKRTPKSEPKDDGTETAFTQYMEGDGATGENTAYGNTPGNTGMRLGQAGPRTKEKGPERG